MSSFALQFLRSVRSVRSHNQFHIETKSNKHNRLIETAWYAEQKNSVSNGSANSLHLIIGMYDVVFFCLQWRGRSARSMNDFAWKGGLMTHLHNKNNNNNNIKKETVRWGNNFDAHRVCTLFFSVLYFFTRYKSPPQWNQCLHALRIQTKC